MSSGPSPAPTKPFPTSARPFLIGSCILLLIVEFWVSILTGPHGHWTDFRSYYTAGYMLRTQPSAFYDFAQQVKLQNIFSPAAAHTLFIHPVYEALLFEPFSLLPYRTAYFAYVVFSWLVLIATFFAARPAFSVRIHYLQPRPGLMLLFFLPVAYAISWGQDSVLFLCLCCLTWRQLQRNRDLSAGSILALALFRFQLAIPIALLIAARRGWRFFTGFLATTIFVLLLCIALVGRAGVMNLSMMLTAPTLATDPKTQAAFAKSIHPAWMPNLRGMLFPITQYLSPHTAFIIVALASLCLFIWTLYQVRREPNDAIAFAIAILCSVLLSYHFYVYDLTFLVLAMALLARRIHYIFFISFWVLQMFLAVSLGLRSFFLLGVPLLALLIYLGISRRTSDQPANAPLPVPLYT